MSSTVPEPMGCEWPIDEECLGDDWPSLDPAVKARALALASNTLRRLTGYRVGGCPITVRPCKKDCADGAFVPFYGAMGTVGWGSFRPGVTASGAWINSCGCASGCGCSQVCEVDLPTPVGEIEEVKVDGAVIAPTDYALDNGHLLVWTGQGDCPWPACQDLSKPDTEVGTFSVTYLNSYPVDGLGAYAAGVLAAEYAAACMGKKCRLPANVTSVTRQGTTFEINSGSFPDGFTGIREVDAYIALWNPYGVKQPARVWSPDLNEARVRR